jgi:hypothetical protein
MVFALMMGMCPIASAQTPKEELVVRDVSVFQVSAYGQQLNARTLFRSTFPGTMLSQRPAAPRNESNIPAPLGIITFEGTPIDDVDVMLEFDSGRILGNFPAGSKRSQRLLWPSLRFDADPGSLVGLPENHWLAPLRGADRMYVHSDTRSGRFLLYDLEVAFVPRLKVTLAEGGFAISNGQAEAIHDVTIYKPVEGGWKVASAAEAPGTGVKPAKDDESREGDEKAAAESVFEDPNAKPADGARPAEPAKPAAEPAADDEGAAAPAAAQPAPVAAVAVAAAPGGGVVFAATPAGGQPAATPDGAPAQQPAAPAGPVTPVPLVSNSVQDAAAALAPWRAKLAELGLGEAEVEHVLKILEQRALRRDTTMAVFRLDPQTLEDTLPLEVTPLPDRLVRVSLVILQDADPELEAEVERLIGQLADPVWKNRIAAQDALRKLSHAALPKLTEAVNNSDVEVAFRAEQLVEELQAAGEP